METNRIFICLGYLVIFSASSSKSLDHYECSQEGSQVIKALKGGHIKGKETVIDFHRDEPLIPGSYECHVTADVSGYLYVSVLRVPLVEHCGTEVTVEKQTIIKRACNYGDIVPSMHLINKTSPLLLKLQILTEPHNSDYCFQLSGNVELNIECKSNHVTCDVQNVLLFGFGIVGLLLLLMLFRNKSFEVNQLFFTSQKGPKKINMTCTGSLQYPTLHVGQTVEKNHLILSTNV